MTSTVSKRLDLATENGSGSEFNIKDDGSLIGKFVITGAPSAAIKIFEVREERGGNLFYKASCSNWNGASVALHTKTTHADDAFSASGVVFTENAALSSDIR